MSPQKQPLSLGQFCRNVVENLIFRSLDNNDGVKDFLTEWIPGTIRSEIISETFLRYDLDSRTKFKLLKVLFSDDISSLSLGFFSEATYEKLAKFIKGQGTLENLTILNLRGVWFKGWSRDIFLDALRRMTHLKKLTVNYIATDRMMDILARTTFQLTFLDISGASEVSDLGLRRLHTVNVYGGGSRSSELCRSLRYLNLACPGMKTFKPEAVADLLRHLKELVSLGGYPHSGEAIKLASVPRLKLKYIHDTNTTCETFGIVSKTCPDIQGAFWSNPQEPSFLKYLNVFENLRKLKLSKVKADILHSCLEKVGPQLRELELINTREALDLSIVAANCSNLTSFEIFYSHSVRASLSDRFEFSKLKKFTIYCTEIPPIYVVPILRSCPAVEKLTLGQCDFLTDDEFISGVRISECAELVLLQAPSLTVKTVRFIVNCLPKITFLGRLDTWNVNYAQVQTLRKEVKERNLDLRFWEIFNVQDAANQDLWANPGEAEGEEFLIM